jgi:hypothetical protein
LKNFYRHFLYRILAAILKMADISKFWKCRIAPLMVTYHYVKFYVSIIKKMGSKNSTLSDIIKIWYWVDNDVPTLKNFYRSSFSKWPSQYRTNSTLSDYNDISYVYRSY